MAIVIKEPSSRDRLKAHRGKANFPSNRLKGGFASIFALCRHLARTLGAKIVAQRLRAPENSSIHRYGEIRSPCQLTGPKIREKS